MANQYPKYNFNDPNLDYDEVYDTALTIYSDLLAQGGCCNVISIQKALTEAVIYLYIAPRDKPLSLPRYKDDVKSAYLTLYNVA